MRVLVTGSSGFIGRHLVRRLREEDYEVAPFDIADDLSLDVLDKSALRRAMRWCEVVIHLAAGVGVRRSMQEPEQAFEMNTRGTLNALDIAAMYDISKVVFTSTFGALQNDTPYSPYAASKLAAENWCQGYTNAYKLPTTVLRLGNVYGPGSEHKPSAINEFMRAVKRGDPMRINGDGEQTRDFVYVDDVVDAIIAALTRDQDDNFSRIPIITGTSLSIRNVAESVRTIINEPLYPIEFIEPAEGEVRYIDGASSTWQALRELRWSPKTPFLLGLERTWRDLCES